MSANFDFSAEHILEDDIVLLRPLKPQDFDSLVYFALNEPDIWQFNFPNPVSEKGMHEYLNTALKMREQKNGYAFIVYDKRSKSYAGSTRFYDIRLAYSTLEIGFTWYGKAFRGTGLNAHCKYLLLDFAFTGLKFERVGFRANSANERSRQAMKKIGCVEEGVMRNFSLNAAGERTDSVILSILKNEWERGGKENLKKML